MWCPQHSRCCARDTARPAGAPVPVEVPPAPPWTWLSHWTLRSHSSRSRGCGRAAIAALAAAPEPPAPVPGVPAAPPAPPRRGIAGEGGPSSQGDRRACGRRAAVAAGARIGSVPPPVLLPPLPPVPRGRRWLFVLVMSMPLPVFVGGVIAPPAPPACHRSALRRSFVDACGSGGTCLVDIRHSRPR